MSVMSANANPPSPGGHFRLFLCGDVMTGRGIDQILPHSSDPTLHEPYVRDARSYVQLAEEVHGMIPRPVDESYIWGDALEVWDRMGPDFRIVNLETAITTSDRYWPGKAIHYRMSPRNVDCLNAARVDCCALANNHVLDWGSEGMLETLETLRRFGIKAAGAGRDRSEAESPATLELPGKGRVLVFSFGTPTSGIPLEWAATDDRPGVHLLPDLSAMSARAISQLVARHRRGGDIVVASIHWGGNWGYTIPGSQRQFARRLVDEAGVAVVHGHSSHHVQGIEVYQDRLILYGCGDFLTDYEGIPGHEDFRPDWALMYFADIETSSSGRLIRLQMAPLQSDRFRLRRATNDDILSLSNILNREGLPFGTRVRLDHGVLELQWGRATVEWA